MAGSKQSLGRSIDNCCAACPAILLVLLLQSFRDGLEACGGLAKERLVRHHFRDVRLLKRGLGLVALQAVALVVVVVARAVGSLVALVAAVLLELLQVVVLVHLGVVDVAPDGTAAAAALR